MNIPERTCTRYLKFYEITSNYPRIVLSEMGWFKITDQWKVLEPMINKDRELDYELRLDPPACAQMNLRREIFEDDAQRFALTF